jgi:hypothetical protein
MTLPWIWPSPQGTVVKEVPFDQVVDVEDLKRRYAEVTRKSMEAEKAMLKRRETKV